jgi:HAE1 family hydrophobic/amphiphilic exporter-1
VATNSQVNAGGGRVYVDLGKSTQRKRSAAEVGIELRGKMARLVGAEYVVLDDLNNGGASRCRSSSRPDSRTLLSITNAFMDKLRQVPGAVDVGLSEQAPRTN